MYDFERGIERKGTNCVKWDVPFIKQTDLPMWIADMDFQIAPAIQNNLKKVAGQGAFGYQFLSEKYYQSVMRWMKQRHGYELEREEICFIPNVVVGLAYAIQTISKPGDEIIVQTPAYGPFFEVVKDNNRVIVENRMKNENGYYTMDYENLERIITSRTKAVIICNPHNPTGRVWKEEELRELAQICEEHNLYILSDDIHSELLSEGNRHVFITSLSEKIRKRSFIFTSPSKAFNLAGIHVANCFIADEELRKAFMENASKFHASESNAFAEAALTGAYDESGEWLDELNKYINDNLDYFVGEIQQNMPGLYVRKPEGTYLVWVDFRNAGIDVENIQEVVKNECGIIANAGDFFGKEGEGFLRFNVACSRDILKDAVNRLKKSSEVNEMENEKKKGLCGICPDKCWIEATIENGKLVKVEPDKDSPFGRVCPRGALSKEIIYSKDRILHPMVRIGKKGEGKFRRATWEEALEKAAEGFLNIKKQYGARALASYVGTSGREDGTMRAIAGKDAFFQHLGSPNDMSCGATCFTAANVITPITTLGIPQGMIQADFENAEIVVVWGTNLKTNSGPGRLYEKVKAAQKRGAYLIVIDPRKKGMGMEADWWIPVVPGSDGALALAMLKIIVEEEKYDKEFVEKYTEGFEEFSEYLKQITVEEMSDYCGVDCEIIRLLADKLCSTTKAVLSVYTGIEYQRSAVQNYRAIQILWAITGKYDVEGGMYINGGHFPTLKLKKVPEQNQPIGSKEFPLFYGIVGQGQFSEIPKAVLNDDPYPVRGLLIAAASPALTYPDKKLWHKVYEKLDFLVVNERFMSEEIMYADVVFPATTYYENQIPVSSPLFGWKLRNRIIQPLGEARNDVHILQALAEKMGFGEVYPKSDEDTELWMLDGNRELLEKLKCSEAVMPQKSPVKYKKYQTGDLRKDGMPGFPTPSGKFEICSKLIEECGYTGLPVYKDIRGIKELGSKEEYPMILTTGARSAVRFASFGPAVREIIQLEPYPVADINLEDAKELGINEGQKIWIETVFGKQSFRANICEITRGCIHAPFGSGGVNMLGEWKETNINEVCSMEYHDELSGFLLYKSMPCRVVLAE